jgi:hypothetical protein
MTITFKNNQKITGILEVYMHEGNIHVNFTDGQAEVYKLEDIKSIELVRSKPYVPTEVPTSLQASIMTHLQFKDKYRHDKAHSVAAAGVVLKRALDGDFWLFGLDGEIMHNPEALSSIKLK